MVCFSPAGKKLDIKKSSYKKVHETPGLLPFELMKWVNIIIFTFHPTVDQVPPGNAAEVPPGTSEGADKGCGKHCRCGLEKSRVREVVAHFQGTLCQHLNLSACIPSIFHQNFTGCVLSPFQRTQMLRLHPCVMEAMWKLLTALLRSQHCTPSRLELSLFSWMPIRSTCATGLR